MAGLRYLALQAAFEALWLSRLPALVRRMSKARGLIFTLHRVVPEPPADFSPNAILQVTPSFLEAAIVRMRQLGYETVTMDEAVARIAADAPSAPFVVFSFDDAYRDNLVHALPVLRRHNCPFTLYVPTAFVDGVGEVWWQALEDIVAMREAIALDGPDGEQIYLDTKTDAQKHAAYNQLYAQMRAMPEPDRVQLIRTLGHKYGLDLDAHCKSLIMDWAELKTVADDPLCTIGAHTVNHYELSKLPLAESTQEIAQSIAILTAQFGTAPQHFAYPIGSAVAVGPREHRIAAELGLKSAVTTRPGGLYAGHREALHNLPRISLNGLFQQKRYLDVFAAPALFSLIAR